MLDKHIILNLSADQSIYFLEKLKTYCWVRWYKITKKFKYSLLFHQIVLIFTDSEMDFINFRWNTVLKDLPEDTKEDNTSKELHEGKLWKTK